MALRVDNIVVSDKNVIILDGDKQYIADIEKENEKTDSININRNKNSWNLYTEDGHVINNIFSMSGFDVRTQVVTGSNGASTNYKQTHENFFMPNQKSVLGICQFYDYAYTLSDRLTGCFSTTYNTTAGNDHASYTADNSFIRYKNAESYENTVDYYITPYEAFYSKNGVQYFTEYSLNRFYSDFGDNEDTSSPTVYGDSCMLKYYLDEKYSVNCSFSIVSKKNNGNFDSLRRYYSVGNTGNSIYLTYRNYYNGTSEIQSNGCSFVDVENYNIDNYTIHAELSGVGYFSNAVIMTNATSGIMYAADPYSDFFQYNTLQSLSSFDYIKQPTDLSFILFFKYNSNTNETKVNYISKNNLDKYNYSSTFSNRIDKDKDIICLKNKILIGNPTVGLMVVSDYSINEKSSNINFSPFKYSKLGNKYSEDFLDINQTNGFTVNSLYYNNDDIVGIIATSGGYSIPLLSTNTDDNNNDIGEYFLPVGNPKYELDIKTEELYSPETEILSSVLSSWQEGGIERHTWILSSVYTTEMTGVLTSEFYSPSSNYITNSSHILFDYSPIEISDEIKLGNYVFMQFGNYGLAKCHVSDIFNNDKFVKSSTAGIINTNKKIYNNTICTNVHFEFSSYGSGINKSDNELSYFIDMKSNSDKVYCSPAMIATYDKSDYDSGAHYNTFSVLPFSDERDVIVEPTFCTVSSVSRVLEQVQLSSHRFILNMPISNSYALNLKTYSNSSINHDMSICLVKWNSHYYIDNRNFHSSGTSLSGLHLQYCGLCTEMFVNGSSKHDNVTEKDFEKLYNSTVYEYPHQCYGNLKTAGTGISIFDGELSSSMTTDDILFVNGYLVVKNYAVENKHPNIHTETNSSFKESGKTYIHDSGTFPNGGYVVTNAFVGDKSIIDDVYDSKLVYSSKKEIKTKSTSEKIYDYSYLWHIYPKKSIEFYPVSNSGEEWSPYYVNKYVDFIKYHNGYYYIALSTSNDKNAATIGYELIETNDLFIEKSCTKLKTGTYISGINCYDNNIAVEYTDLVLNKKYVKWFKQGNSDNKTFPIAYCDSSTTESISSVNRSRIDFGINSSGTETANDPTVSFDNVEIIESMNRFTSVVNHKSNMFSIKISDLGLDNSPYLSNTQKKNIKTWFKNRITNIVDSIKPANTQLFDVYID